MSDGTQRQIMVILRPFVIQRRRARWHSETNYGHSAHFFAIQTRSCPMARRDKLWSFCALLSSRGGGPDDMRRQIMVIPLTFSSFRHSRVRWHAQTNYGHFAPFVIKRRRARWHAETNYGHPHAFAICKTRWVISAQRQIMVILCPLSFRSSESSDKRAETNYGHSAPCVIQKQRVKW